MSEILIDGYNLLRASPYLLQEESKSLEAGRNALISMLAKYRKFKNHKITVVFDGQENYPSKEIISGIKVIFTPSTQQADDKIKIIAMDKKNQYIVVTSDREIIDSVKRFGAVACSSKEFLSKMELAYYQSEKGIDKEEEEEPRKNKKGLSYRLPKKKRLLQKRINKL